MKMYNNGPRKAMMYGGMSKRKPMMYGGMATRKAPQESSSGGMMTATQGPAESDAKPDDAEAEDADDGHEGRRQPQDGRTRAVG